MPTPDLAKYLGALTLLLAAHTPLSARDVEWSGLLDVRAQAADGERSWTHVCMGKLREDGAGIRLGQAILAAQVDIGDALSATAVLNRADRPGLVDLQEAWLGWNPVPTGPWKVRARAGLFFPPGNQEIDYQGLTWTPSRTISASAINSWIGEELRTKGLELSLTHRGRASGSPHDFGATAAVFNGNDPAGTLLAWRGWGVGDRIGGGRRGHRTGRLAGLPRGRRHQQAGARHPPVSRGRRPGRRLCGAALRQHRPARSDGHPLRQPG